MTEIYMLSDMKEHEFKELCAEIFRKLGYSGVELICGRPGLWGDIILTSPERKRVIVLCIHCLGREVGKDEIFSFCEEVYNSTIDKGIIVTTGHLSKDALHFVDAQHKVEVWDLPRFREMANKAGIKLGEITYDIQWVAFPAMTTDKIMEYIVKELLNIRGFITLWSRFDLKIEIEYHPVYLIEYRRTRPSHIERVILLKKLEGFQTAYIDGRDGKPLPHLNIYDDMPLEPLRRGEHHVVHDFTITPEQAIASLYGFLGERYVRTESRDVEGPKGFHVAKVSTNHFYVKITSITRVMLPIFNIRIKILNYTYTLQFYTKPPSHIYIIHNDLTIYRKSPHGKMAVCNECGGIQNLGLIRGDAKTCWKCREPFCEECVTTEKKWLIIPVRYCRTCMEKEKRRDEETRKQHGTDNEAPATPQQPQTRT